VAGGGSIQGYTGSDFAAYFLVLMVADQITFTWIMWEYEFQIKSGQFATQLIKPVHPVHRHVADNVTHKLITLVVLLPTFVVLAVLFRPSFHTTLASFLLFIPVVLLGAAIRYLVEYTLALAAFFTTVSGQKMLYALSALTFFALTLGSPPLAVASALVVADMSQDEPHHERYRDHVNDRAHGYLTTEIPLDAGLIVSARPTGMFPNA